MNGFGGKVKGRRGSVLHDMRGYARLCWWAELVEEVLKNSELG
jgi:hypothetical protein